MLHFFNFSTSSFRLSLRHDSSNIAQQPSHAQTHMYGYGWIKMLQQQCREGIGKKTFEIVMWLNFTFNVALTHVSV
jgi:hypothetical protein